MDGSRPLALSTTQLWPIDAVEGAIHPIIASAAKQSRSSYVPQGAIFRLPSLIGDADGRRQADSIQRTLQRLCLDWFALLWRKKAFPIDLYRSFAAGGPRPEYRVEPMAVSAVRENVAG